MVLKLLSDHPNVTLHTQKNFGKFIQLLTWEGMLTGDLEKLNMKEIQVSDFLDELPKSIFTIAE